jgi:hypothetical protein
LSKVFPAVLIVLDLAAAFGYALDGWGEWRRVVYWTAAAVLTYTVTF